MITQTYNLNLVPSYGITKVRCSQYDVDSRIIEMHLFNGSVEFDVPNGAHVTVRGTKKDKKGFEYTCAFTGNVVTFTITEQMALYAGEIVCEIRIAYDGKVLGTSNFLLVVEESPLDAYTAISASEYPIYEELARTIEAYHTESYTYAQQALESANLAKHYAEEVDMSPMTVAEIDEITEA